MNHFRTLSAPSLASIGKNSGLTCTWLALVIGLPALTSPLAFAQSMKSQSPGAVFASGGTSAKGSLKRIYPMRQDHAASNRISAGRNASSSSAAGGADLQYYGGPVISNVQVVVVYWSNSVSPVATNDIPNFLSAAANSTWADILSEYSTNGITPVGGSAPGDQSIGRGTMIGAYTITPSAANSGATVDDTQIQAELQAQINAGSLPAPSTDANGQVTTLYMIYFPPGVTITLQGSSSCVQFCAYHGTFNLNKLDLPYGVMPDLGPTTECSVGCAGGTELDDLTTVSSHEMAEAITDPGVGLATTNGPPLGWYDTVNGEIGDICNASGDPTNQASLPGTNYVIQKLWSNLQQDCVAAPPTITLSAPASVLSGSPFNVTLTVQSSTGVTLDPPYAGTVAFTSTDTSATLPANYTFSAADSNSHTFTNVSLNSAGQQTITVTDTHSGGFVGTTQVSVTAHTAPYFSLSVPYAALLGTPFTFTVTAETQSGNLNTAYSGTVQFTSSDPQAVLPANAILTNGTGTFTATLRTSGRQTITATDTATSAITGTSASILASGPATHFAITVPASATTGSAFIFIVVAQDQFNNTAVTYGGTVRFASSDAQAVLPTNATLANGSGTFSAVLRTIGTQTITATDTVSASITITSAGIVTSAAATHLAVSAPASVTSGTTFNVTVTALDQSNNVASAYTGTVVFASSDLLAGLPPNSTLTNGSGTFDAALRTGGMQTITATDTVSSAITGTSGNIAVSTPTPAATPTFSPYPGTYTSPQTVTIADTTPGVTIYYTTDGSTPTTSSPQYAGPLTISTTTTLMALAGGNNYANSAVAYGVYRITAVPPIFSPYPGTYTTAQTVTITDATPGVTIYYTTDGTTPTPASAKYVGPITISATTTLQAIGAGNGYGASSGAFGVYRIAALPPTFSPAPGTYASPQSITISDASPGALIYYTTDGSTPTTASPQYASPITLSSTTTLQAIAAGNGYSASSVSLGIYKIGPAAAPSFSPVPGAYSTSQSVTISDSSPGVSIYYTTDGSTPTTSSHLYSGPVVISATTTLQAMAVGGGYGQSPVTSGIYKISGAATPAFSPTPGNYASPQSVAIADSSPGVTIYYTTDGSMPTTASTPYTAPVTISKTTTLQAIAAGNGYTASSLETGTYKIATPVPTLSPYPGNYSRPQSVTISDAAAGATVYYTTDGSTPTTASPQYNGPIAISSTTTLQAIAAGNGYAASAAAFGIYRISAQPPTFSPYPGTYSTPQTVTISDASSGATIYYTTDGSMPTTASPKYTGPITISSTTTLQAIAAGNGFAASTSTYGIYRIVAATPTFSPNPGSYTGAQTITISDTSPGVTIYYTTDGTTPTTASPKYPGPVTLSATTTLQAIAVGNGYATSLAAFGIYRIN